MRHKKFLGVLCGTTSLHIGDTFWSQFGQFSTQLSSLDPKDVQKTLEPYCRQLGKVWTSSVDLKCNLRLVVNSRTTGNLQTLMLRIIGVVSNAEDANQQLTAANGLCFLKFVFKSLLEKLPGPDFISFIEQGSFIHPQKNGLLFKFVKCLVGMIVQGKVAGFGYLVVLESILCLVIGCSTQLYVEYVTWSHGTHPVLELLINESTNAPFLLQNLLSWFTRQLTPSSGVLVYQKPSEENPSVFKFVRQAAVSVLWLPVTAFKYLVGSTNTTHFSPLAEASQHLFLILVHHVPYKASTINPYREALHSLHDVAYVGGIELEPRLETHVPSVCYSDLYLQFSKSLNDERGTLMLYTVLQCVQSFRDYASVRSDLQTIVLPLLKQSYQVSFSSQSQVYLLSIILLIFSQDSSFSQEIHRLDIQTPDWFKDGAIGKVSLGSFMVMVLLRTAHRNLAGTRDLYLHTNTMAALANVVCMARDLDALAAQKFLGLINLLNRKYTKLLLDAMHEVERDQVEFKLQFYKDFLHMMLEILNGTIYCKPANNCHLVYSILQREKLFDELLSIGPEFQDLAGNIQILIQYFNSAIEETKQTDPEGLWDVKKVLELVRAASSSWTTRHLGQIPDLRFSYEEEDSAEQFFVPVVWTLVVSFTGFSWNTDSISLFRPQTPTASAIDSEGAVLPELISIHSNGGSEMSWASNSRSVVVQLLRNSKSLLLYVKTRRHCHFLQTASMSTDGGPTKEPLTTEEPVEKTPINEEPVPEAKVVVFGGNGFVGSRVCEIALGMGLQVISINRSGRPSWLKQSWADGVEWIQGDALQPTCYTDKLSGALGAVSCVGGFGSNEKMYRVCGEANIRAIETAASLGVPRFAFISVHHDTLPGFVKSIGYFRGKLDAEETLRRCYGNKGVSLRPFFIHGTRQISDNLGIPLQLLGTPLEKLLGLVPNTKALSGSIPILGTGLVPPVRVEAVARAAVSAITDPSITSEENYVAIALTLLVISIVQFLYWFAIYEPKVLLTSEKFHSLKLILKYDVNYNTRFLRFALPSKKQKLGLPLGRHMVFKFQPKNSRHPVCRPYTPVSDDTVSGHVDFVIKLYPQGLMSQHLMKLKLGDRMKMKGPKGKFKYKTNMKRSIGMLAGGSGITPMYQLLKYILNDSNDNTHISLIYANATPADILLRQELDNLVFKHPIQFNIYYVIEKKAPVGWKYGIGYISKDMIEKHCPAPSEDSMLLWCGPPPMVDAMKRLADEIGYPEQSTFKF
eukprot:g6552.t1